MMMNKGYRKVMQNCRDNAMALKEGLQNTGQFTIVSKDIGVPVVAFSLKDRSTHDEFKVSEMLRRFGWIVPAYRMPKGAKHVSVLRVVVREDFSRALAERLLVDIIKVLAELDTLPPKSAAKAIALAKDEDAANDSAVKKTAEETEMEIVNAWIDMITKATKITCC